MEIRNAFLETSSRSYIPRSKAREELYINGSRQQKEMVGTH
jgi:hypothetical protein